MPITFTLDYLRCIMRESIGVDESVDFDGDILDIPFSELGYDSLAILELVGRIGREHQFAVPDDDLEHLGTPAAVLDYVRARIGDGPRPGTRTENSIFIEAPLDLVWDMTNDVAGWPNLFTEYSKVDILEDDGDRIRFHLYTHPDENDRVWDWISERRLDRENRTVYAERVSPGPFEYMHIAWDYTLMDGQGVRMRWVQEFHLKPEAPVDDATMAERINRHSIGQMSRIKRLVEQAARQEVAR